MKSPKKYPSKTKSRILFAFCNSLFLLKIFKRMQPSIATRGWSIILITSLLSVYLRAHSQGIPCHLIEKRKPKHSYQGLEPDKTVEYLQNTAGIRHIKFFQDCLLGSLELIIPEGTPSAMLGWNGMNAGTQATQAFAKQFGIPTLLFELGNIDSRLFADPEGVNAASFLVKNPELLDAWEISDEEFFEWLANYMARRRCDISPPQARSSRSINPFYLLDRIGTTLLGIPQPSETTIINKVASKLQIYRIPAIPAIRPISPYVFLPLQVSSDTNLLIMSDYGNLAAIEFAGRYARELGCNLVVKVHPAELNRASIIEIIRVCTHHGYLVTSLNTTELILDAMEIVTINSAVGLEGLLYGKKVTILGKCIYKDFTVSRTRAYVLKYLINFDPYGEEPMSLAAFDQLIERFGIGSNAKIPIIYPFTHTFKEG